MKKNSKSGFTLVELSLVLVITGLIIAGVLTGQNMINSAKVSKSIQNIQQFDIAVANFKQRYNQLPGDTNLFDPAGDYDGYLTNADTTGEQFTGEIANFWVHLSLTGFNFEGSSFTATVDGSPLTVAPKSENANIPSIEVGRNTGVIAHTNYNTTPPQSYYYFAYFRSSSFDGEMVSSVRASDVFAIDSKIDDSNAITGSVIATIPNGSTIYSYGFDTPCTTGTNSPSYDLSNNDENCTFITQILSQTTGE